MLILGINAFHADSSAAIVRDGQLIAAAEEERFRRIKHWAGFPEHAIRFCLKEAGARLGDVTQIAINTDPAAHRGRKVRYALAHRPDPRFVLDKIRNKRERMGVEALLSTAFPGQGEPGALRPVEHHRAHLASAFFCSPFEESAVVSVDGFGDFASAAWGIGRGAMLSIDSHVWFPHSLGAFYTAITQYLGFPNYGDEYKVMGLAPYGAPRFIGEMRQVVRLLDNGTFELDLRFFRHARERLANQWSNGSPTLDVHWAAPLAELLGPSRSPAEPLEQRHKDIARSAQAMYEEAFEHVLRALHARHRVSALAIAGGCGMNSVANGKVTTRTPFEQIYVQSAAGDAGGAIGAALAVWHEEGGKRCEPMRHAYWGPSYDDQFIRDLLQRNKQRLSDANCQFFETDSEGSLVESTAAAIADGQVVGWFQGPMEWGPRALGNRSILGDPRRADMKDILNLKIKRRESFRPFAPSVKREAVAEWFELDGDVPFMMQVYPIRESQRGRIPAVTHVDGTGRLQTVTETDNPRYYRLISAFDRRTGVPMVLNTSFNENEPVVCRPEEAIECFLRTKMDLLVMGSWMVVRESDSDTPNFLSAQSSASARASAVR